MTRPIIFFDLDNTLIEGPFGSAVFPQVLAELTAKTQQDPKDLRHLIVQENFERQEDPYGSAIHAMDWDDIFQTIAQRLGVTLEANAQHIVQTHAKTHSHLLPHVRLVLDELLQTYTLVLATKGLSKYQQPVLEALDLTRYFAAILTPDVNHALKKDRAFYGEWLNARVKIMVGDLYADDVLPAQKFGMHTIWKHDKIFPDLIALNPAERPLHFRYYADQPVRPTAIIHSLKELPATLTNLLQNILPTYEPFRL